MRMMLFGVVAGPPPAEVASGVPCGTRLTAPQSAVVVVGVDGMVAAVVGDGGIRADGRAGATGRRRTTMRPAG